MIERDAFQVAEQDQMGAKMHRLMADLYPICRSLTGNGVRQTLHMLNDVIPLIIHEVPTGTTVFDWTIPQEWNIRDAYIKNSKGDRVVDFRKSNLHVMGYSVPVSETMSLAELLPRLYSLPEHPEWIPQRASYYKPNWGFSIAHNDLVRLAEDQYEVRIDSTLSNGAMTYGECVIPGEQADEILFSTHICHPSLCNDNLSGIVIAAYLAKAIAAMPKRRYTYRFLFVPTQLGSLAWLARNQEACRRIRHGVVLVALGDIGCSTYKCSRQETAEIDRVVTHVLRHSGQPYEIFKFVPYGYDERQYCSPGFNLPVGCFMRSTGARFPEYHTSADNLECVKPSSLADSYRKCIEICYVLEGNRAFRNLLPNGEPQLGKRGLYGAMGGLAGGGREKELLLLWALNLSDGSHTLLDIAERSGLPFRQVRHAADLLLEHGLLEEVEGGQVDAGGGHL
jgi:aminopeptidase-like protein